MPTAIAMPKLGMTMTEGRVVAWPVAVGERVERGQVVLVIESEKAEVEIEAPASGVLRYVYVPPGETVPCGTLLAAVTETADEAFDAEALRRAHGPQVPAGRPAPAVQRAAAGRSAAPSESARPSECAPVTPAARRVARELGVDPARVAGTGPGGRVTQEDVEAWAAGRRDLVEVAPGVSLEVPRQGEGETVLLLPGFGTDVSAFAPQTLALAGRYSLVGVNPRGVGRSDAPEEPVYPVATMASDAAALTDRPVHVIGASLGAAVAMELALARPERVRSLTLLTPFARAGARLFAVIDAWCRLAAEASAETLAHSLLPWLFSPRLLADEERRERVLRGLVATVARVPAVALTRHAAGLRAWSGTREGDLARIAAPALVVMGEDDLLTPDGVALAARIGGARVVTLPTGHAVGIEAPGAVNEAIAAHLGLLPGERRE